MSNETAFRRRKLVLAVVALLGVIGVTVALHDALSVAFIVAGLGSIWCSGDRKARVLAAAFVAAGLFWSSIDQDHCSAWWRGKILYKKLRGGLDLVEWKVVWRGVIGPCFGTRPPGPEDLRRVVLLKEATIGGRKCELFEIDLGRFWVPAPGRGLLAMLQKETTVDHIYDTKDIRILSGDTVIDCGAHVGVYTRYSLQKGAAQVVAIEPDATNIACFEANFAAEIAAGRVRLVRGGVWDKKGFLALAHLGDNSAGHTFVLTSPTLVRTEGVPVCTLDEIVDGLGLDRVDFIKMDIEGAESRALKGAERTIMRYNPKLAVSVYHLEDEAATVRTAVMRVQPKYRIAVKDLIVGADYLGPKVMFFR